MKIKTRMVSGVLSPSLLEAPENGEKWLNLLKQFLPEYLPEFIDNHEPIKSPFQSSSDVVNRWRFPLLWKRKTKAKVQGSVLMGNRGFHTGFYMDIASKVRSSNRVLDFVEKCAIEFRADFAYLHVLGQPEVERAAYSSWYPLDIGITLSELRKGLPSVPWAMILGKPYVDLLGEKRLLDPPVGVSRKISYSQVSYQLSDKIEDLLERYPEIEHRRTKMKKHLGPIFQGDDSLAVPPSLLIPVLQ
jgi:hypothetical protein